MNYLFGDSNVMRNSATLPAESPKVNIIRMTAKGAFDAKISTIRRGAVVLANINMMVANEVREIQQLDARVEMAKIAAEDITLKLGIAAKVHAVKCAIIPPLPLLQPSYYSEIHQDIMPTILETIKRRNLPIRILEELPEERLRWCNDGIHLEEDAGKEYFRHIMEKTRDIWENVTETESEVDVVEKIVKLAYRESPSSEGEGPSENKRLE
jgi:hypothetical protein